MIGKLMSKFDNKTRKQFKVFLWILGIIGISIILLAAKSWDYVNEKEEKLNKELGVNKEAGDQLVYCKNNETYDVYRPYLEEQWVCGQYVKQNVMNLNTGIN